jgi:hypothetical protein
MTEVTGLRPRLLAWQVLQEVGAGAYADGALERVLQRAGRGLTSADRALVTELAYGTVRQRGLLHGWLDRLGKVTASPLPDQGYSEDLGSDYRETAVFGEVGYRITPQWRVGAGARVFKYDDTANVNIVDWALDMSVDIADIADNATATIADIAGIATASATIVARPRLLELISIAGILVLGSVHGERRHGARSLECACQ